MVKYYFFKLIKTVCVLPNHGFILLTTHPDHTKVDTKSFIPPNKPYELRIHEFGDEHNKGKIIAKIDGNDVAKVNLIGRGIALSTESVISFGVIGYAQ